MKVAELLDWLDGRGMIWVDDDLVGYALDAVGLTLDTEIGGNRDGAEDRLKSEEDEA